MIHVGRRLLKKRGELIEFQNIINKRNKKNDLILRQVCKTDEEELACYINQKNKDISRDISSIEKLVSDIIRDNK
tara:strand:+ start:180 stop:404 length:225 start_codon:yes stop_codon:yes gene_type:complete